jgi:transposase
VREALPDGEQKLCFDRFHIAQYFNKAVDKVRAEEHREFKMRGEQSPLTRTKHAWLRNGEHDAAFSSLARSNLKTARAWRIKEVAAELLRTKSYEEAARDWRKLLSWMTRSRLGPVVKVAAMIRQYLWGILNATRLGAMNAKNEAVNATIQKLKARACGFRNRSPFKLVILFHLGGLSLLPEVIT